MLAQFTIRVARWQAICWLPASAPNIRASKALKSKRKKEERSGKYKTRTKSHQLTLVYSFPMVLEIKLSTHVRNFHRKLFGRPNTCITTLVEFAIYNCYETNSRKLGAYLMSASDIIRQRVKDVEEAFQSSITGRNEENESANEHLTPPPHPTKFLEWALAQLAIQRLHDPSR